MVTSTYKAQARRSSVSEPMATRQKTTRQLSVLIADDTPAYQKIIRQILQDRGHTVTHVSNGKQAVECYLQHRFDVIVVDVQMPVMNGFEVASWIRSQEKSAFIRTPIVAITAHGKSTANDESMAVGIDAYLTKPIDIKQFVDVIEKLASQPTGSQMKTNRSKVSSRPSKRDPSQDSSQNEAPDLATIVDYQGAMGRLGGDEELFREFISVYDEDIPVLIQSLRIALDDHDASGVERNAHSVRGLISNFGARRAVEAAAQMEEAGKHARWDDAPSMFDKLLEEIRLLSEALDSYRRS
jgi:CheY-like chemotaxis protein